MENIRYIPVRQADERNYRTVKLKETIYNNKTLLIVSIISVGLLTSYVCLFMNFIKLISII